MTKRPDLRRQAPITLRFCLAAIAFAGVFGLMHYVTKGPNRVSEHDEEEATRLEKTKGA